MIEENKDNWLKLIGCILYTLLLFTFYVYLGLGNRRVDPTDIFTIPLIFIPLFLIIYYLFKFRTESPKEEFKEEIKKLINEDINYQKTKLKHNFEKDQPILWRIEGMNRIKLKLK